ncbi:23S rRNA (pseudouridine(1915)-N(3))-methyltransferase RlmH [Mesoplasma lactucae]|uniref:Ribosomal RNA large subunit methyltransferase H n=1 Tax=Mesoplasma lactucae ATCC 49193 TaxID=81460 RepID=A0A291IR21_9MOLU|nr:23S rRNA (pseudouridine(1915)-N(3))-methyltransferase RlmH [Mesoplasma lactucae]ATG97312.1 50S rRNA methyltransferase [Mesoplasma lactucae ATCC 49193]ATZ20237.1 rRNA large subunit methyltransferase [Mesoplasma lactucae ATCC 49193]MCL8216986.1 Ribosomal RNA large subunit methyltransferase H [Mesoplasma lactucae ATCC 49193]
MNIKIICFGKLDNKCFQESFDFYADKVKKRNDLEVIELKEEFNSELEVNKKNNCEILLNKLDKYQDYEKIVLDVNSKEVSSPELAEILMQNKDFKGAKILFIIGPSDGFTSDFKKQFQRISFGKITLPHQLFRVVLIEQIYRAIKINNNEKYHK